MRVPRLRELARDGRKPKGAALGSASPVAGAVASVAFKSTTGLQATRGTEPEPGGSRLRRTLPLALAILLWLAGFLYYADAAVLRHQRFETNALDLGFMDQTVWNTAHGRLFEFSIYRDPVLLLDIPPLKRRVTSYLAFHVEPILLLMAMLYWLRSGPETLLVAQALIITAGVLPAFLLARRVLGSDCAAVAFGLAYLLSPAIEAALLSDYHSVALSAAFFMAALYFLEARRPWAFVGATLLAVTTKEEVGLVGLLLGLYAAWRYRLWWTGVGLSAACLAWVALGLRVIIPYFSGGDTSLLAERYAYLGATPQQMLETLLVRPSAWAPRVFRPESYRYLAGLLADGGFLALLSPLPGLLAAPELGINLLSTFDWMQSGGGHYSALIVPFLLVSAMRGMARLRGWLAPAVGARGALAAGGTLLLTVAFTHHLRSGVSPLTPGDPLAQPNAHDRLGQALASSIPAGAGVSAGSTPLPHVSERVDVFPFPTLNNADYILLDVTRTAYPTSLADQRLRVLRLLADGEFGVAAAQDGWLVLRMGQATRELPASFLHFTHASPPEVQRRLGVRFGDELELVGVSAGLSRTIGARNPILRLSTFWQALVDNPRGFLHFAFGALGPEDHVQADQSATSTWLPPDQWRKGELMRVGLPPVELGEYSSVSAIASSASDPADRDGRLPITSAGSPGSADGTMAELYRRK